LHEKKEETISRDHPRVLAGGKIGDADSQHHLRGGKERCKSHIKNAVKGGDTSLKIGARLEGGGDPRPGRHGIIFASVVPAGGEAGRRVGEL